MTTTEFVFRSLWLCTLVAVFAPVTVYQCVKLGAYAYLVGRRKFWLDYPIPEET